MIYVVRHGKTDWNEAKKIQGQTDIPLNEHGKNQARKLKQIFEKINYDLIISSDLSRAIETANIINYKEKEMILDKRLREINYGKIEGIPKDKIPNYMWDCFHNNPEEIGSEPIEEVFDRIKSFIDELDKEKDILIITHGGVIRLIAYYLDNLDLPFNKDLFNANYNSFKIPNAEVFTYNISNKK